MGFSRVFSIFFGCQSSKATVASSLVRLYMGELVACKASGGRNWALWCFRFQTAKVSALMGRFGSITRERSRIRKQKQGQHKCERTKKVAEITIPALSPRTRKWLSVTADKRNLFKMTT